MTNTEIEQTFEMKLKDERRITKEIVELIALADERKIYALRGYSSLYEWLTIKYRYSEGSANRRIAAARLLRSVPEAKIQLENGDLKVTTMAKAQSIIRAQEKVSKRTLSREEKAGALKEIENKSAVHAEQALLSLFPEAASQVRQDRISTVNDSTSRLNANVPNDVMERYKQVRDVISNALPNASFIEAADYLFKKLLSENVSQELAPPKSATATAAKRCVNKTASVTNSTAKQSINNHNKTITPKTKRIVLQGASCTFKDPLTGKVCGSRYKLQVDHRHPKALGGDNHAYNLRPLCATHNRVEAEQILGHAWANQWREHRP